MLQKVLCQLKLLGIASVESTEPPVASQYVGDAGSEHRLEPYKQGWQLLHEPRNLMPDMLSLYAEVTTLPIELLSLEENAVAAAVDLPLQQSDLPLHGLDCSTQSWAASHQTSTSQTSAPG